MAMTFLNQQDFLSRILGDSNTGTDDMFPLADRKFEINRGELHFARDSKLLLGRATGTVSSQSITLPTDWIETFSLVVDDENFTNDREISLSEYERYVDSGGDYYYYWTDTSNVRKINFINTNQDSQSYILFYFRKPSSDLSSDGDESPFPDEYREASVYFAAARFFNQIGKASLSDRNLALYGGLVSRGRVESERLYMNKERAIPDLGNTGEEPQVDIQGKWPDIW